MLPCFTVTHA